MHDRTLQQITNSRPRNSHHLNSYLACAEFVFLVVLRRQALISDAGCGGNAEQIDALHHGRTARAVTRKNVATAESDPIAQAGIPPLLALPD